MTNETVKLNRTLGPIHLWGIAVGLVISGDYFGWNFGWSVASFWEFAIAVFFIGIFYISFALCFTELAASIPHAGGPSAYAERALGKFGGFVCGYLVLCEFILAPPAIASALGGYVHFLFPLLPSIWVSYGFFILLVLLNLLGVKQTAKFELFVTVTAVIGLLLYLIAILPSFSFSNFPKFEGITSLSIGAIFASIPFAIWFFLAVEGVAMAAEEVKNPKKDIPLGYTAGIGTLIILATSIFIGTAGVVTPKEVAHLDYPLSYVLGKIYGIDSPLVFIFSCIGLFGLIASLFGIILGYSRLIYALSVTHFLPRYLSKLSHKTRVPMSAVLSGGVIGLLGLTIGNTAELITASALGACGMYVISMISFFVLRKKEPDRERPYTAPFYPTLPIIAIGFGFVALLAVAYSNGWITVIVSAGLVGSLGLFMMVTRVKA